VFNSKRVQKEIRYFTVNMPMTITLLSFLPPLPPSLPAHLQQLLIGPSSVLICGGNLLSDELSLFHCQEESPIRSISHNTMRVKLLY
jgi:hypothetical protein